MRIFQFQVTEYDIESYAEVSQDRNPIHLSEKFAKVAGFSGRIAHGMLTLAKVVSIMTNECLQPSQFMKSYEFTFSEPVYVNDIVTLQVLTEGEHYRISGMCEDRLVIKGIVSV